MMDRINARDRVFEWVNTSANKINGIHTLLGRNFRDSSQIDQNSFEKPLRRVHLIPNWKSL